MDRRNNEILGLAIPNILSNISVPLLSSVDTALMGGLSTVHLAAVGLGGMVFNVLYWNFGFLRMGTTGITAQAYGREDQSALSVALYRGLVLSTFLAFLILLISIPFYELAAFLFNIGPDADSYVSQYFFARIWAAPATLGLYVLMGWLFGNQNAVYPLIITIVVNICNIAASYYLVQYAGYGIAGVAWGTVLAQYFGVIVAALIIWKHYREILAPLQLSLIFDWRALSRFLKINADIFVRTACLTFVFSFFYSQSMKLGSVVAAANVILQQFINWMSYAIDGFAYATESLVGKYKGKEDYANLRRVICSAFLWSAGLAVGFTVLFIAAGDPLASVFSPEQETLDMIDKLKIYLWVFPVIAFGSYIWDGVYVGLVASKSMRDAMLASLFIFLVVYYSLPLEGNGWSLWVALCTFMFARVGFQSWLIYKRGFELP